MAEAQTSTSGLDFRLARSLASAWVGVTRLSEISFL
jgi:hypothetical protein